MATDPDRRVPPTGASTRTSHVGRRIAYIVGIILVLLVLLSLLGTFDMTTDAAATPAPAKTEGSATPPAAPAAPQ